MLVKCNILINQNATITMYDIISKCEVSCGIKKHWSALFLLLILLQTAVETGAVREPEKNILSEKEKGE